MLSYLALSMYGSAGREALATLLWSDRGEEQARASLRQCLMELRKFLEQVDPLALEFDRQTVRLRVDRVWVDALEAERLLASAQPLRAAALWRGDLLADVAPKDQAFGDWLRGERIRRQTQFRSAMDEAMNVQLSKGELIEAANIARELVRLDPTHETAHQVLMHCHANCGETAAALRQYKELTAHLSRDLDSKPNAATETLVASIRAGKIETSFFVATGQDPAVSGRRGGSLAARDRPLVLVLPFLNLTGDPAEEFLTDGITDDLITFLGKIREILVVARNSSFQYKRQDVDLPELARVLKVKYVLQGSVRRVGDRLRVNAWLCDAPANLQIWTERYEVVHAEVLNLVDDILFKIRAALVPALEVDQVDRLSHGDPEELAAYDCYLRGKYLAQDPDSTDVAQRACNLLERAIELNPRLAIAYGPLIRFYNTGLAFRSAGGRLNEHRQRAYALAVRLLELDAANPNAHIAMAWCCMWRRQFSRAQRHFDRALKLDPYEPERLAAVATGRMYLGEADAALELMNRALELAPYELALFMTDLGQIHFMRGDYAQARKYLDQGADRMIRRTFWSAATFGMLDRKGKARAEGQAFIEQVRLIWRGEAAAGPDQFSNWFLQFCPFRNPADEERLRAGLRLAALLA